MTGGRPVSAERLVPAGEAYAGVLAGLQRVCFPEDPWTADSIAALLVQPGVSALLACGGDEPAGFVMIRVAAEDSEILALGVAPEARRRGTGRRLVDGAVAAAMAGGATAVFLEVAEDNKNARALYSRAGFAPVGRRPGYYRRTDGRVAALVLRYPAPGAT